MLGWVGCNRHGLAFTNNDLLLDTSHQGLPSQVVRRLLLAAPDVASALDVLAGLPHMGGRSYLLGDPAGEIAGVEVSPTVGCATLARTSLILHTNNALLLMTKAVENETALSKVYPSSHERLASLEAAAGDAATVADVMNALQDRIGEPDSVAKSLSAREGTETAFSIVFDCRRRTVHLCPGLPFEGHYTLFRMP